MPESENALEPIPLPKGDGGAKHQVGGALLCTLRIPKSTSKELTVRRNALTIQLSDRRCLMSFGIPVTRGFGIGNTGLSGKGQGGTGGTDGVHYPQEQTLLNAQKFVIVRRPDIGKDLNIE